MVTIFIPTQLQKVMGGTSELQVNLNKVGDIAEYVKTNHPEAVPRLFRADGKFNLFVNVYVNGEDIKFLKSLETPLKSGDEVSIVPAIAGG